MEAELRLKRVYECAEKEDGVRVLVDRLWPRGVRKDALACDLWRRRSRPPRNCGRFTTGESWISKGSLMPIWRNFLQAKMQEPLQKNAHHGWQREM